MLPEPAEPIEQRLLAAALEAATIHGVTKLSMGDVARRAGLSRQTLYRYFPSKDALIAAVVGAETTTLIEQTDGTRVKIDARGIRRTTVLGPDAPWHMGSAHSTQ